jgi:hypothetical protein
MTLAKHLNQLQNHLQIATHSLKSATDFFDAFYQSWFQELDQHSNTSHQIRLHSGYQSSVLSFSAHTSLIPDRQTMLSPLYLKIVAYSQTIIHPKQLEIVMTSIYQLNQAYIKLLPPTQINQAYLFNICHYGEKHQYVIEHILHANLSKNRLEKYLWLWDHLLKTIH